MEWAGSRARTQEFKAWMCHISPSHCTSWFIYLNNWIGNISISEVGIRIELDNEGKVIFQNAKPPPNYYYCNTDKHLGVFHTCSLSHMCEELCVCYTASPSHPESLDLSTQYKCESSLRKFLKLDQGQSLLHVVETSIKLRSVWLQIEYSFYYISWLLSRNHNSYCHFTLTTISRRYSKNTHISIALWGNKQCLSNKSKSVTWTWNPEDGSLRLISPMCLTLYKVLWKKWAVFYGHGCLLFKWNSWYSLNYSN